MSTIVKYFVPEDKDVEDKPNGYIIYKDQDKIRLKDINENFPLPGEYVFRFKTEYQQKKVWLDFTNEEAPLPTIEGKILMKVNRISWTAVPENQSQASDFPNFS